MRARLLAAASLSASAVVLYFWIDVISKTPLDIRSDDTPPQKEVCQGFRRSEKDAEEEEFMIQEKRAVGDAEDPV
ncbi:unnamed protein product [Nippostrongylus brasiliensis]|uniref:Transmembrane protein n=1 Tax=Nippostrongylus brasiliensis TaxID=27835 RepID=A0A0N4XEV4_NIPBR|nr:unnamed protein product [Nippostrongylus brasiliensis]